MILTLDTSILIDLEQAIPETIEKLKRLSELHHSPAHITFISYFEFYFGITGRSPKNYQKAYEFLQKFPVLQPTKRTAEILAKIKKEHEQKGQTLPLADLLIVSQVQEHNLLLVTKDKDFQIFDYIPKVIL
ncbi:type II toxin-antitoxin system VapC family toxin [Candidatus Woesearchaeota archaeon]|nr:type II toxin-antitoxin system VapC family toxin [Candidatus Woesearchaeota archaeon]